MPTVVVLGAYGVVARAVARLLQAAGHTVIGVVRPDPGGVSHAPTVNDDEAGGAYAEVRRADLFDPAQRASVLGGADLVVNTLGPMRALGLDVARTACAIGVSVVDVGAEQTVLAATHEQLAAHAISRGVRVVIGAGLQHLVGEALAILAAGATTDVAEVHIAYLLPDQVGGLGAATTGRRRSIAAELGAPTIALVGGERVRETVGERRRLAWFPRPVGPSHAASFAGGEAITLPQSLPDVPLVRTYLAIPGWRAEVLQARAAAARNPTIRQWLTRHMQRPRAGKGSARRKVMRWACVAEVGSGDGAVARAWAYGHDPYATTAASAAHVARRVLLGDMPAGVLGPAQVDDPGELLHAIATASDLRWSVASQAAERGRR